MSGVNSSADKDPLEDLSLTLARNALTEPQTSWTEVEPQTSRKSPADQVRRIPDFEIPELLPGIFADLAEDSNLEELLNLRLICPLWKRHVYLVLKSNLNLLPWVGVDKEKIWNILCARAIESKTDRGVFSGPKSLDIESYIRNVEPGCGVPIKVMINKWNLEVASFLRNFSSDIVSVWIYGGRRGKLTGLPDDLGSIRIELPELEHASFYAVVCDVDGNCDEFRKALAFWKMLLAASKKPQTCHVDIELPSKCKRLVSPDDEVFHLLEWSGVNSLSCTYEFYAKVSASKELSALQKLDCTSTSTPRRRPGFPSVRLERQLSLEKTANLTELRLSTKIDWKLKHPMKNLKVLTLNNVTITCVPNYSPSVLLPKLEMVAVVDYGDVRLRSPTSCLISRSAADGGIFENVVELRLNELWLNLGEDLDDVAVRIFDSFPKLTQLKWRIEEPMQRDDFLDDDEDDDDFYIKNALRAAPVIFSKLEHLTRLELMVSFASERDIVELVTGVPLEEIPEEEDSWPNTLVGNSRSITNLKRLQSFNLIMNREWKKVTVTGIHARFLFTAGFRTMTTLKELYFMNITFEDTSCVTEWQEMGRMITIDAQLSADELSAIFAEVVDHSSGDDWETTDSDFEPDGEE